MRALSEAQAGRCENALHKACSCRCGGQFHGRARVPANAPREAYQQLPDDDPHHLPDRAKNRPDGRLDRTGKAMLRRVIVQVKSAMLVSDAAGHNPDWFSYYISLHVLQHTLLREPGCLACLQYPDLLQPWLGRITLLIQAEEEGR